MTGGDNIIKSPFLKGSYVYVAVPKLIRIFCNYNYHRIVNNSTSCKYTHTHTRKKSPYCLIKGHLMKYQNCACAIVHKTYYCLMTIAY